MTDHYFPGWRLCPSTPVAPAAEVDLFLAARKRRDHRDVDCGGSDSSGVVDLWRRYIKHRPFGCPADLCAEVDFCVSDGGRGPASAVSDQSPGTVTRLPGRTSTDCFLAGRRPVGPRGRLTTYVRSGPPSKTWTETTRLDRLIPLSIAGIDHPTLNDRRRPAVVARTSVDHGLTLQDPTIT